MSDAAGLRLLRELHADRWFAHRHLFAHRHPDESALAHEELVAAINRPAARLSIEGFRRFGKTTYLEETAILKAVFREFHNMVIVGPSFPRASERIGAIKNELEVNPYFADGELFGQLRGEIWQDGKIVLSSGVCIQALGRDQSMTGMKFREWRPDAFLIDDIEDPQEKRTDAEREDTWRWLMQTFLPSLDDVFLTWGRFLGTRRGKNSLPERLENEGVPTVKFPLYSLDAKGARRPTWPAMFPLPKIRQIERMYRADMDLFAQEYMCEAVSAADRVFDRTMFKVEPRIRTYEAVYAMIDPARTVLSSSATTGWAVWSWVRNRLVVWASGAPSLLPDEIIALAFDIAERFDPVWLAIEEDGLEEFLLQPLRHEQVKRGITIPYRRQRAPRDKRGFIRGLQWFFAAGEVSFAQPQPELEEQFLSFPHGKIDGPNALAYALLLRPGAPIYDDFREDHIVEDLAIAAGRPLFVAVNAAGATTSGVLVQAFEGSLRILADWVMDGPPAERIADLAREVGLYGEASKMVAAARPRVWQEQLKAVVPDQLVRRRIAPVWVYPRRHTDKYMNVGLLPALRACQAEMRAGGPEIQGSLYFRDTLTRTARGVPAVEIAAAARWTLRALGGGYTRAMVRGQLQEYAEDGPYKVLMEGLEAFCGMVKLGAADDKDDDTGQNFSEDRFGNRYVSAIPARR